MIAKKQNILFLLLFLVLPIVQSCGGGSSSTSEAVESGSNIPANNENERITETPEQVETVPMTEVPAQSDLETDNNSNTNELSTEDEEAEFDGISQIVAYRPRSANQELSGAYSISPSSNIAAFGSEPASDRFMFGTGTLDSGITNWLSLGNSLPGMMESTRISSLGSLSKAVDGSVAFTALLVGSQPGAAIASIESDIVDTVVRDGQSIELSNGNSGVVRSFSAPKKISDATVFTTVFEDGRFILVSFDGEYFTSIADSVDGNSLIWNQTACKYFVQPSGQFQFFVTDLQETLFTAVFDEDCPINSGIIKHSSGQYELLVADDQSIDAMQNTYFGLSEIIESDTSGAIAIINNVSIDYDNEPSNSTRTFARSWWEVTERSDLHLILVEGETVETLTNSYVIDSSDVKLFDWVAAGYFAAYLELSNESALFIGKARNNVPYLNFTDVGASVLKFEIGTTSEVPDPFNDRAFFEQFDAIKILSDGRVLFQAKINSTDGSTSRISTLWISDGVSSPVLLLKSGDTIPFVTGGEENYTGEVFNRFLELSDGSVVLGEGTTFYRLYLN